MQIILVLMSASERYIVFDLFVKRSNDFRNQMGFFSSELNRVILYSFMNV